MVKAPAIRHELGWLSPGPMWGAFGDLGNADRRCRFARPAILRFATDGFMEELAGTLALHPEKLAEWEARWETWERPMASPSAAEQAPRNEPLSRRAVQLFRMPALLARGARRNGPAVSPVQEPDSDPEHRLKLFQPVQNRFYLVSASLICQQPGLPDRRVNPGKQEQAGFVLRRLIEPETGSKHDPNDPLTWDEYAFVQGAKGGRWVPVGAAADTLLTGEERLPMFSLGYTDARGTGRRLFAGLIPVGRREAYIGAPMTESSVGTSNLAASSLRQESGPDTRLLHFAMQVTGPWHELVESAQRQREKFRQWTSTESGSSGNSVSQKRDEFIAARERIQTTSWYVLLDFERFLERYVNRVWKVLAGQEQRSTLAGLPEDALLTYLERIVMKEAFKSHLLAGVSASSYAQLSIRANLMTALEAIATSKTTRDNLEAAEMPFGYGGTTADEWPSFLFPLADPHVTDGPCPLDADGVSLYGGEGAEMIAKAEAVFEELTNLIQAALPAQADSPSPDINIPTAMDGAGAEAVFAIRCVYERPNCGPLDPPVVSAPTELFEMAGFFDPEAPARQVRIALPFNISPAALRKYNKSATLVVSDMLCGQIKRIRQLSLGDLVLSVLPWPFHKDLPSVGPAGRCGGTDTFGMLCSLSIPIVTLCALILLLIIVALFDLFFRWLPLLFVCFPVPKLGPKRP